MTPGPADLDQVSQRLYDEVLGAFALDDPIPTKAGLISFAARELDLPFSHARAAVQLMEQDHASDLSEAGYQPSKGMWGTKQQRL